VLRLPESRIQYTLAGLHSSKIIGSTYVTTEVDADFWSEFKGLYKDFQPLKSGAIFEASSAAQAESKAKELVKEKTGLEPMPQDTLGIKTAEKE